MTRKKCDDTKQNKYVNGEAIEQIVFVFYSPPPSPRRGRGILVAPGFCPASRFLVGAKTTGQFFFEILT